LLLLCYEIFRVKLSPAAGAAWRRLSVRTASSLVGSGTGRQAYCCWELLHRAVDWTASPSGQR